MPLTRNRSTSGNWYALQEPPVLVLDESSKVRQRGVLNFIGSGVTATADTALQKINVTITGGGGGASTLDDLTDVMPATLTYTLGHVLIGDGSNSYDAGFLDSQYVTYTPSDLTDWNLSADPGNTDDAIDQLADRTKMLEYLLPAAAPILDFADQDTADGTAGKNTWSSIYPISGYQNAGADSAINPSDSVDINCPANSNPGPGHGVYPYATFTSVAGTLNDDVTAASSYPADSFGPGGTDGGTVNDLKLVVNASTKHTVNLRTFGSGSSLNGNGSGFTGLTAATPVYFADLTPFPNRTYRKGGWIVVKADLSKGWNVIKVQQTTDSGTITTNTHEFLLDDITTATSYASESLSAPTMTGSKYLSGVQYYTGGSATYGVTVGNAYLNTWRTATPQVTFNVSAAQSSLSGENLANSGGDENKTHVVTGKTTSILSSNVRLISGSISVSTSVQRSVQAFSTSPGASRTGILLDNYGTSGMSDLADDWTAESRRIKSNDDFNTSLGNDWVSSTSITTGGAGYNDGLQVTEGKLYYPGLASISNYATTYAPGGNPNYGSSTGTRYYFRYFTNATGASNFRLTINGTATLRNKDYSLGTGTNDVRVCLRLPTQTGWLDVITSFNEGSFGSTSETSTAAATAGCYSSSLGNDTTIPTSNLGITFGTKTTANSYDKIYARIEVPQGWTGNLTAFSIVWGAT